MKIFCRNFRKNLRKFYLNLLKIFGKFCECLKIKARFREVFAIFGTFYLWNFYVKYYKTSIQKLKENVKNTTLSYSAHASLCYQFYIFTFCFSYLFCHMQRTLCPNPQIKYHLYLATVFWIILSIFCHCKFMFSSIFFMCKPHIHLLFKIMSSEEMFCSVQRDFGKKISFVF